MAGEDADSASRAALRTRELVLTRLDRALLAARGGASAAVVAHLERARQACTEGDGAGSSERGALSARQRRRIEELVVASAEGPSLDTLAAACGVSRSQLGRLFRSTFGVAPLAWIRSRRIERAKRLIRDERHTLTEIAAMTGFSDQSHLSRTFKRIVGKNPTDYRRSYPEEAPVR